MKTVATTIAHIVREYVFETYVVPARQQHFERVTVKAGDVAKAMHMKTRIPFVCEIIGGVTFQEQFGIKLLERTGARVGSNALFTFQVFEDGPTSENMCESIVQP
jgi:5-methylcytosine-specific restriction enzyme B